MKTSFITICFLLGGAVSGHATLPTYTPPPRSNTTADAFISGMEAGQAIKERNQRMKIERERAERERQQFEVEQRAREAKANAEIAEMVELQIQLHGTGAKPDAHGGKSDPPTRFDPKTAVWEMEISGTEESTSQTFAGVTKLMSHDEYSKAGLTKLSGAEIKALDGWIQRHTLNAAKVRVATAEVDSSASVIETRIDGDFEGWSGDTIWKMLNGQIWQQAEYSYTYSYAYNPKVLIYRGSGGWKMKVDGESDEVSVKRVK